MPDDLGLGCGGTGARAGDAAQMGGTALTGVALTGVALTGVARMGGA